MNYLKIINNFKKVNKETIMIKIEIILISSKGKITLIMKYQLKIKVFIKFLKVRNLIKNLRLSMELKPTRIKQKI